MFDIVGGKVILDANSLSIPPFKNYYNKAKDKSIVTKELEYVIFLYKWNTPYKAYPPEDRQRMVAKDVFGTEDYKESVELKDVISRYEEFQHTPLIRLYLAAENALEYLIRKLSDVDNDDFYDPSKPFAKEEKVAKLLTQVDTISKSLESSKNRAIAEQLETGKVRGGGTIGHYEKPR